MNKTSLDIALKEARARFGPLAVVVFDLKQTWSVLVLDSPFVRHARPSGIAAMTTPPRSTLEELVADMIHTPRIKQSAFDPLPRFLPPVGSRAWKR